MKQKFHCLYVPSFLARASEWKHVSYFPTLGQLLMPKTGTEGGGRPPDPCLGLDRCSIDCTRKSGTQEGYFFGGYKSKGIFRHLNLILRYFMGWDKH